MSTPRRDVFEFKVQACQFAFVGLYSSTLQAFAYEVVLGYQNNEKVVIVDRLSRDTLVESDYNDVLRLNHDF